MLSGYVSHRDLWNDATYIRMGLPNTPQGDTFEFFLSVFKIFGFGHNHTMSLHSIIAGLCIIMSVIAFIVYYKRIKTGKTLEHIEYWNLLRWLMYFNITIAILSSALFTTVAGLFFALLKINTINFARIYHVTATSWYMTGGVAFVIIYEFITAKKFSFKKITPVYFARTAIISIAVLSFTFANAMILNLNGWTDNWFTNVGAVFGYTSKNNPNYAQYYDTKLFKEIETYIKTHEGKDKNEYRVGSIGMAPAVPSYNGFYCIDGYVQNYSLDYWNSFYNVIAGELESKELGTYFLWGNRCYFYTEQTGKFYHYGKKHNKKITSLDYDIDALKDLAKKQVYLFSAAEIVCNVDGITPLRAEPFETPTSWWRIYVYKII
jgi:hypothetical protein